MESCSVEHCDSPIKARDLCGTHLQRWYRWGSTDERPRPETKICKACLQALPREHFLTTTRVCEYCYPQYMLKVHGPCKVEGCERYIKARGWCDTHLSRWYRWGSVEERERPKEVECLRCSEKLPLEDFPRAKDRYCVTCFPVIRQERSARRLSRENNTTKIVAELREKQDHRCAICGIHEDDAPKKVKHGVGLYVDHCHETMKIRGLLCTNCNIGLGHFKDNPDLLAAAISYLKDSKPLPTLLAYKNENVN